MQDAISNLRKARSQYIARQQEYEKAKEASQKAETDTLQTSGGLGGSAKVDKKKKVEEDAMIKAAEAETTYKACVVEANTRQQDLEKGKGEILTQIRELIYQCDQTMKAVTVGYFQLQHTLSAPAPVQYQTLCESCRQYEPGTRYAEFVKRLPNSSHARSTQDVFVFEPYTPERFFEQRKRSSQSSSEQTLPGEDGFSPGKYSDKSRTPQPLRAWGQQIQGSDTESASGGSSKSHDSSPSASPHDMRKKIGLSSSMDELAEDDKDIELENRLSSSLNITSFKGSALSKAAQTHSFRKLRSPSKCRECDSYVYFQGAECEKCGLASHKKCLEILSSPCGHRSVERRMTMFGVDFNDHLQETQSDIPCVVAKCILEIDKRGLDTKGIYRVSGVKSKVERLCQSFENGAETVDLSDQHTNVISNVLKLYLRQLPQPLITISLYPELMKLAKEETGSSGEPADKMVILRLRELVTCLPKANFKTLSVILHHLKRVSDEEELNQMSSSNLGIVFGPTLLRPSEGTASLNSLMDTPHQSRIIELLIDNVEDIFGASPPLTSETPIEKVRLGSQHEVKLGSPATSSIDGARANSTKQTRADVSSDSIEESFLQSKEGSQRKESLKHILLPGSTEIQSPRESVDENEKTESEEELATDPDCSFTTDLESDDELPDTLLPDSSAPSPTPPKVHSPLARIAGVSSSSKSTKAVSTSALQLAQTQTLPTKTPSMLSAESFDSPGVKTRSTSLQIGTKEASQEDKRRSLPSDVLSSRESSTGNPNRSSLFMDLGGPIDFGHHRNLSIQTGRMSPGQSGSVSSSTGGKQSATQGTGRSLPAGQGRQSPVTSGSSSKGSQALIPSQRSITDSSSKSPSKQSPSIKQPLLPTTVYTVPPNRGAATTVTTTSKPKSSPSSSTKFSPSSRSVFYAGDMVTEVPSRSTFYAQELVDIPVEPERGIERGTSAYSSGSSSNGSSSPGGAKAIKREPRYV
ncbi:rho GTPase-activating protein 45 [Lingula anatina]|uniref:Rho GTPase-activating protein 45 n=1 Tax=Lingula anatina TaxID=7574 RepID=A0A2R2MS61_LINAN|nr:rho GTPase-activating protein 45 [Lingula anatina]|eukprot:XP_023933101.1 rho GTPase-activating protein 45 [Lingula anatina]